MDTYGNQAWPVIGVEATLQSPSLSDLDWMMEAHEEFGDNKFFLLLDRWLGKHDVSALFEMLYVSILKDQELQIIKRFAKYNQPLEPTNTAEPETKTE